MNNDQQNSNEPLDWHQRWLVGDEEAFAAVEALHLPKQLLCFDDDFADLGLFAEQAQHLLFGLTAQFGKHLPFIFGIAIRMRFYTSWRAGSPEEHQFSVERLSYDEDNVSKKFRLGTPLAEPIAGELLLIAEAVLNFKSAVDRYREYDMLSTFDELYQATHCIAIATAHNNGLVVKETIESGQKLIKADAGRRGGKAKHKKSNDLKAWALEQVKSKSIYDTDKNIAKTLLLQIPSHLADASIDPERLIYDSLRDAREKHGIDKSKRKAATSPAPSASHTRPPRRT